MIGKSLAAFAVVLAAASQTATSQPVKTQPMLDYSFASAIPVGTHIGRHVYQNNVRFVGIPSLNDDGEVGFVGEWLGSTIGAARSKGVFTSDRVVVEEGEKLGKNIIVQIVNVRSGDIQINSLGQVAYLATVSGPACGPSESCKALIIERDIKAISNVPTASFVLTEEGSIQAPPGAKWITPSSGNGKSGWLDKFRDAAPSVVTPPRSINLGCKGCDIKIPSKTVSVGTKAAAQTGPQLANFPTPAAYPNCPMPTGYQFPFLWPENGNATGPISSSVSSSISWGLNYKTAAGASKVNWIRKAYFSQDCRAILVSLTQPGAPTAEELWTPAGLLAAFDADNGVYHFAPVGDGVLPPSSTPIADGILVNSKCQVLIPVALRSAQSALILATPNNPGHCQ